MSRSVFVGKPARDIKYFPPVCSHLMDGVGRQAYPENSHSSSTVSCVSQHLLDGGISVPHHEGYFIGSHFIFCCFNLPMF